MKKNIKLISVFIFLTIFVFSISFRSEASKATAAETNFSSAELSRALFTSNCARCHGADGKGETETGKLNDTPNISGGKLRKWSVDRITKIITKGDGSMPAFGGKLTKKQIASLVRYVRGL